MPEDVKQYNNLQEYKDKDKTKTEKSWDAHLEKTREAESDRKRESVKEVSESLKADSKVAAARPPEPKTTDQRWNDLLRSL